MNTYFSHGAPILIGLVGEHSGELANKVSQGGRQNLWYTPNPTPADVARAADGSRVAKLSEEDDTEALNAYLDSVARSLSYPASWDHISINAPIHEAFKARVGTTGDGARNRILYQILMAMQDLFTPVPDVEFELFVDLVHQIYQVPLNIDGDITQKHIDQVRQWVSDISAEEDNHIVNRAMRRLREKKSAYDEAIEEQYVARGEYFSEINHLRTEDEAELLDQLPRVQCLILTEISTAGEAAFVKSHTNGILLGVNPLPEIPFEVDGNVSSPMELIKLARTFIEGAPISGLTERDHGN